MAKSIPMLRVNMRLNSRAFQADYDKELARTLCEDLCYVTMWAPIDQGDPSEPLYDSKGVKIGEFEFYYKEAIT